MGVDPAVVIAVLALISSLVGGGFALKGKKGETKVSDDANLRDDQREFITELRSENAAIREARAAMEKEIDRLRLEMRETRIRMEEEIDRLRLELHQTRTELEQERLARRAGDAAVQAEHQSRTAGSTEIIARQAGDQARQDIHDESPPRPHGATETEAAP